MSRATQPSGIDRRRRRRQSCFLMGALVLLFLSSQLRWSIAEDQSFIDLRSNLDVVRIDGVDLQDRFGGRTATCDINSDGIDDLVVGVQDGDGPDNARQSCGEAYVILGQRGQWTGDYSAPSLADSYIIGADRGDRLGYDVACGDVNGDGFDDLLLAAQYADGPWNSRHLAGGIYVVFGDASLPALVDLSLPEGQAVIHGAEPLHLIGFSLVAADLNGDGMDDVAMEANAPSRSGNPGAGREYIVFGKENWPAEVDLAYEADVLIWGVDVDDDLGANAAAGDLDGDGIDDLVVVARLADGPDNTRNGAGELNVFWGRESWPSEIDLAREAPDIHVIGADEGDQIGNLKGLAIGDVDGNTIPEILAGTRGADGVMNEADNTGEMRILEYEDSLPPIVDLGERYDSVVFGVDAEDQFCARLHSGRINRDRTDDVACSADFGDGPSEGRTNSGEVHVMYGRSDFPLEIRLADGGGDVIVHGAFDDDRLSLTTLADINGDGFEELVLASSVFHNSRLQTVWVVSPLDTDEDGIAQLSDNCPLVANPDQIDGNYDGLGDACENDYDGDGLADDEDCAPLIPAVGELADIQDLRLTGSSPTTLTWKLAYYAETYDVVRGFVVELDGQDYGACQNHRDANLRDNLFEESDVPEAGQAFFYLVRGANAVCPVPGNYGPRTRGEQRSNGNPDDC